MNSQFTFVILRDNAFTTETWYGTRGNAELRLEELTGEKAYGVLAVYLYGALTENYGGFISSITR